MQWLWNKSEYWIYTVNDCRCSGVESQFKIRVCLFYQQWFVVPGFSMLGKMIYDWPDIMLSSFFSQQNAREWGQRRWFWDTNSTFAIESDTPYFLMSIKWMAKWIKIMWETFEKEEDMEASEGATTFCLCVSVCRGLWHISSCTVWRFYHLWAACRVTMWRLASAWNRGVCVWTKKGMLFERQSKMTNIKEKSKHGAYEKPNI